jgi:hypothetical protein
MAVTVTTVAQPSTISGPTSVCTNATGLVYSVDAAAGVSFNWDFPAGWTITSGQGTNSVTVDAPAAVVATTITVTPTHTACSLTGAARTLSVTLTLFNPANPASVNICPGTHNFGMTTVAGALTYLWEQSSDGVSGWGPATGTNNAANYTTPNLTTDMWYRRTVTHACGSVTSPAVKVTITPMPAMPTFMAYNLGANPTYDTPKKQMTYLANNAQSNTTSQVFGALYQWGRTTNGHQLRTSATTSIKVGITYDANGQPTNYTTDFIANPSTPYDWKIPQQNNLWGNGVSIGTATPGGGAPGIGANSGNTYQQGVRTVNDPCPSGYRVPTQDEWEMLGNYCNPAVAGSNVSGLTGFWETTTGYTWVAVRCGGGQALAQNTGWAVGTPGGYAIYSTAVWDASGLTTGSNLIAAGAPEPLLFLPAVGYRYCISGAFDSVGIAGHYWSSSISTPTVYTLSFYSTSVSPATMLSRAYGFSVRCVAE